MKKFGIATFLSNKFDVPEKNIRAYLHKGTRRYRTFEIEKRNGKGKRKIAQPTRALKIMQQLVLNEFFSDLPIHHSATAYIKNTNIKDNANIHKKNAYILKMDFKDFFPSISENDLISHIKKHLGEVSEDDKNLITNLFLHRPTRNSKPVLSIGAPSSPFLSNTLLFDFDCLVEKKCKPLSISYTRYADDLTFSTNKKDILYSIPTSIKTICSELQYPKLLINNGKTVFASKSGNRHITGLVITNEGEISIGREKKRKVKALVHKFNNQLLTSDEVNYLKGYLSFTKSVEPEFIASLIKKYGRNSIDRLMK